MTYKLRNEHLTKYKRGYCSGYVDQAMGRTTEKP